MSRELPSIPPESLVNPASARCPGACTKPSADRVDLLSGENVCTWCPAWRTETLAVSLEAAYVLRMTSRDTRHAHLASREASFGAAYRSRLHAAVMALWESRRKKITEPHHG